MFLDISRRYVLCPSSSALDKKTTTEEAKAKSWREKSVRVWDLCQNAWDLLLNAWLLAAVTFAKNWSCSCRCCAYLCFSCCDRWHHIYPPTYPPWWTTRRLKLAEPQTSIFEKCGSVCSVRFYFIKRIHAFRFNIENYIIDVLLPQPQKKVYVAEQFIKTYYYPLAALSFHHPERWTILSLSASYLLLFYREINK